MIKRIDEFIGRAFDTATKHVFHDARIVARLHTAKVEKAAQKETWCLLETAPS